jgi:hypothetical protein
LAQSPFFTAGGNYLGCYGNYQIEICAICHQIVRTIVLGKKIVRKAIFEKKVSCFNKASANDSLNNEIIKISSISLAPHVKLFNQILSNGLFPRILLEGLITSIHKSGNKTDPGNYRGICISSCLGKFFTSILIIHNI